MNYQGDITLGDTIDVKFTSVNTSGVPTTLAGSPAIAAYIDNNVTEITAGVTLTVDFDGRVGLHNVRVVASSGNGFATSTNVNLVITAGTVGGNSVVGYVVGSLSIGKRPVNVTLWAGSATATGNIALKNTLAKTTDVTGFNDISAANVQTELGTYGALKPTTAGRTLDVNATGEAGIDWANISAPTTVQNLSGTTVATVTNGVSLTSGERTTLAGVIWNTLTSALTTVGSIGKLLVDNINATISSRSTYAGTDTAGTTTLLSRVPTTAASQTSVDTLATYVDTEVAAIKAKTDQLTFTVANKVDASASVAVADLTAIADAIMKRDVTAISGEAAYSLLNAIRMLRNSWTTSGGVLTVKKEDGSSVAWTRTLGTDPTAQPIVSST